MCLYARAFLCCSVYCTCVSVLQCVLQTQTWQCMRSDCVSVRTCVSVLQYVLNVRFCVAVCVADTDLAMYEKRCVCLHARAFLCCSVYCTCISVLQCVLQTQTWQCMSSDCVSVRTCVSTRSSSCNTATCCCSCDDDWHDTSNQWHDTSNQWHDTSNEWHDSSNEWHDSSNEWHDSSVA